MNGIKTFMRRHRSPALLLGIVLLLTLIPVVDTALTVGPAWQGIPPTFTDETLYFAHVKTIADGHWSDGNPYFMEHADDAPLVIFGGAWLNAIPLLLGVPFIPAMFFNFVLFSLIFAALYYRLFREFNTPPWLSVAGAVFLYLQCYAYMFRPANLQPVYPVIILFYIALARILRGQSRTNTALLAVATGASFYLYSYLWQTFVITLGLLALYALLRKQWPLLKTTLLASFIGGVVGLPVPLYMLWLSHASPYFWESISRFGLVSTHIPMAEVLYSGGWVGAALVLMAVLWWRAPALRTDRETALLFSFIAISGLGLWIMQGSNLITGQLLETGEHLRRLILPWLAFAVVIVGVHLYRRRAWLTNGVRIVAAVALIIGAAASMYYCYYYFYSFLPVRGEGAFWRDEQTYAKPFAWLQAHEPDSVVVWTNPHDYLTQGLPVYTRHFVLFGAYGMWRLVSQAEVEERYLTSQYFDDPSREDLEAHLSTFLGRQDIAHTAKTLEREVKVCRIVFFWDKGRDCGTVRTPAELLRPRLDALVAQFDRDIKPNIKAYLKKYHVSYILKDVQLDPQYHPEALGGVRVYQDGRFELYKLP